MNMGPVSEGEPDSDRVQIRTRGVTMAHALEKFFGELVLYIETVMDDSDACKAKCERLVALVRKTEETEVSDYMGTMLDVNQHLGVRTC